MKSVNEVITGKPILFEDKYIYPNSLNTVSIKFKNFHKLRSHHDIITFNENSVKEITEKYNRRYERLINAIKSDQPIIFIRYCKLDIEENQIFNFYRNIKKINNNLNFKFVLVSDCDKLVLSKNLLNLTNFMYINLNNYMDDDVINETDEFQKIIKKYKCIYDIVK
jgi:hypothetical protein